MITLDRLEKIKDSIKKIKNIKDKAKKIKDKTKMFTVGFYIPIFIGTLYFVEQVLDLNFGFLGTTFMAFILSILAFIPPYVAFKIFVRLKNREISHHRLYKYFFKKNKYHSTSDMYKIFEEVNALEDFEKLIFENYHSSIDNESNLIYLLVKDYILEKDEKELKVEEINLKKVIESLRLVDHKNELSLLLDGKISRNKLVIIVKDI